MPRQFKASRQMKHLTMVEAAQQLGVSQPTLSAWETERKTPGIDALEKAANFYGVTTDFLLGRTDLPQPDLLKAVSTEALPSLHGKPVWSPKHGWLLVDAIGKQLVDVGKCTIPYLDAGELFLFLPQFSGAVPIAEKPLTLADIKKEKEIWLEPISPDLDLRNELRGRYHPASRWVENEYGNRFYYDTYGAKWLAFAEEL